MQPNDAAPAARETGVDSSEFYRPMHFNGEPFFGLLSTSRAIELYRLDLDPDFQRGHVWDDRQRSRFVGHVLEGGPILPIVVNTGPWGEWGEDDSMLSPVVDGKQRVTACLKWERGEIPAELPGGRLIWAADLNERTRRKCSMSIGMPYGIVRMGRPEMLGLYVRLNRGGTIHTEAEIARVEALLVEERRRAKRR